MKGVIWDIPWGIGYSSEESGLISLNESYVGLGSTSFLIEKYFLVFFYTTDVKDGVVWLNLARNVAK